MRARQYYILSHSSFLKQPSEVFGEKGALKNLAKFTEKHLCQSLFFKNVAAVDLQHY